MRSLIVAAVVILSAVVSAAPAAGQSAGGSLVLNGYAGVEQQTFTADNAFLYGVIGSHGSPYGPPQPDLFVSAYPYSGTGTWEVYMIPPPGAELAPGTYANAGDFDAFPTNPVLIVWHHGGVRCSGGTFVIHDITDDPVLGLSFSASWTQSNCPAAVSGQVNIGPPADSFAPTITVPDSRMFVLATGADDAVVDYALSVQDDRDPSPDVECSPPSGSTLPVGETAVTCTATDDAGNIGTVAFDVIVIGAYGQILGLIDTVASLPDQAAARALRATLRTAAAAVERGETRVACNALNAFRNQVKAFGDDRLQHQSSLLIEGERIQNVLGC